MSSRLILTLACLAQLSPSLASAQAPATSDPNARLITDFDQPGVFPTTVTAANIGARPEAGAILDGSGEDFLEITFPSAGPVAWTSSRYNSGDIAVSFGLADPENPLSYPPTGQSPFVDNFQAMNTNTDPIDPNSTDLTTLSWRANIQTGALFATPRHNGVDDGYQISAGNPLGTLYGVSYFIEGFSQGWGFNMVDGEFKNGGNGSSDLVMGHGGAGGGAHEAAFDVATSYFPYEAGWVGAWVNEGNDTPATFAASADGLDASTVTWNGPQADVLLPGVDSTEDGMLFVAPSNSSSTTRIASAFPNASGGWTTTIRLDDDADTTGATILDSGNNFQFLYMPYDAENLVGGHVEGDDASLINGAGESQMSLTRTAAGEYALSVFEADGLTKKTEDNGALVLSVADTHGDSETLGSRAFLSYEYDDATGDFVIQARELVATAGGSDDGFGNDFDLADTDFYFAWVDFENPLAPNSSTFLTGDADGDGDVDGDDLIAVQTEFGATGPSPLLGDADGDGDVDGDDLIAVQTEFGSTLSAAVPEPTGAALAALVVAGLTAARRRV